MSHIRKTRTISVMVYLICIFTSVNGQGTRTSTFESTTDNYTFTDVSATNYVSIISTGMGDTTPAATTAGMGDTTPAATTVTTGMSDGTTAAAGPTTIYIGTTQRLTSVDTTTNDNVGTGSTVIPPMYTSTHSATSSSAQTVGGSDGPTSVSSTDSSTTIRTTESAGDTSTKASPSTTTTTKLTTKETRTTIPPYIDITLKDTSGANMKLYTPMNEFDKEEFKNVICNNTRIYCRLTLEKCLDNSDHIRPEDVIIYHIGSKAYFNTEHTAAAAADETHVSFYVKDPYTNTKSVMNTEQAKGMLLEQHDKIEEDLGYDYTIEEPYERPDGFPGWAIALIVFCAVSVLVVLFVIWRAKKMDEKKLDLESGVVAEKGTQATQAEVIAEMNREQEEKHVDENHTEQKGTTTAIQTHYNDIIAETGAPVVEKYLNKSLKDKTSNGDASHEEALPNGELEINGNVVDSQKKADDSIPLPPPPPPPPVEFSAVDVHRDDWQKDEFPEPPKSPFDLDVAAEEATSELVNLVKEQTIELENAGIVNPGFTAEDGTVMTEL